MSNFKKIVLGIAVLTAVNVYSVGCFAMEKSNKPEGNKHNIEFLGGDDEKDSSEEEYDFFGVKQNENVLLGKKTKLEKQEEEKDIFKKPYPKNINSINLYKGEEKEVKINKKDDENKNNSDGVLRCPVLSFPSENVKNKNSFNNSLNSSVISDLWFPVEYLKNKNGEEFNSKDFVENDKISSKYIMKDEKGDMILKGEFFEDTISKLLKEPFNFNFFKKSDVDGWRIEEKLKFIVDRYKKDILDYYLIKNIKQMYQEYIYNYLKKKGFENINCDIDIDIKNVYLHDSYNLKKNSIYVKIPSEVFDVVKKDELIKELTKDAKEILKNVAFKTKEHLENISDKEFDKVKKLILQIRRGFRNNKDFIGNDKDFKGYWDNIEKGLMGLKKSELCYSYLNDPDNFIRRLGYAEKYKNEKNLVALKVISDLYIFNENGLKIYDKYNKLVTEIQFDEKTKKYNLVRDEYKKLVFVDKLAYNIEKIITNKYKNSIDSKKGYMYCNDLPVNSLARPNEVRKTKFNMIFPDYIFKELALYLSRDITYNIKQILREAIVKTKEYFNNGDFDSDCERSKYEGMLSQKRFTSYAEGKLSKEELESLTNELKKIKGKDIMSVSDYFEKFGNFIDTIIFNHITYNDLNDLKKSQRMIGPIISGADLDTENWMDPNDLEEYIKQEDKIFITKKMNKKIKK